MNAPTLPRRRFLRIAALHTLALGAVGNVLRAAESVDPRRWRGIALGGEVSIDLYGGADDAIFQRCRAEMSRLEGIFSLYDDRSALSILNQNGALSDPPPELPLLATTVA